MRDESRGSFFFILHPSSFHLLGYGFCQKFSPLQLKAGGVSMVQSPLTRTWQDRRISSSWPMRAGIDSGWVAKLNFSIAVLGLRFSIPFLTSTRQVPHSPLPRQLR